MVSKFSLIDKTLKFQPMKSNSNLKSPLKCSIYKPIDK